MDGFFITITIAKGIPHLVATAFYKNKLHAGGRVNTGGRGGGGGAEGAGGAYRVFIEVDALGEVKASTSKGEGDNGVEDFFAAAFAGGGVCLLFGCGGSVGLAFRFSSNFLRLFFSSHSTQR